MTRALLMLALGALSAAAYAAQPEVQPAPLGQVQVGRLFFTPAERAQLDIARAQRKSATPTAAAAEPIEAPPTPEIVTYGGIVRRSDGKSMLWINNRLTEEKDALSGLSLKGKVRPDGSVTFRVPQTGGSIDMKVGQSVELQTGRVGETRKPPAETKPPAEDAKSGQPETPAGAAGASAAAAGSTPAPAGAPPPASASAPAVKPAPETAEKKPAPGVGLKMDLGGRTLDPAETQRPAGAAK